MGGTLTKVDIGHGRGWLAPAPAASLRRIDAQLGRLADINEAGRSPEQANKNRAKWLAYERYLNGGPWAPKAPYALGADESVHCWGYAADTDDSYDARASAVWLDNGWVQTALYPNNLAKHEPWHREYREDLDNHKNEAGGGTSAPNVPKEITVKHYSRQDATAKASSRTLAPGAGFYLHTKTGVAVSQATNVVGGVGPYSVTPHVYAEGNPGDVLEVVLCWQDEKTKPKPAQSRHYVERLVIDKDGHVRASREFKRAVAAGFAVYLHLSAPKTNTGPVKVTRLDCDAYLFTAA
ncbi:M15 family metallopeptidase domain-containing protein [Microbacterium saperdae]